MNPIKAARLHAGLTHRAAAAALGTSTSHLCRIERGDIDPRRSLMERMRDAYGCTIAQLLGEAPLPDAEPTAGGEA